MERVTVFVSAVTDEFSEREGSGDAPGDYRGYVNAKLASIRGAATVQEDFVDGGIRTLHRIVEYIRKSTVVVQLVGDMAGAAASEPATSDLFKQLSVDPRLPPFVATPADALALDVTYTQWEAYIALQLKKPLVVIRKDPEAMTASRFLREQQQIQSQARHLERLRKSGVHPTLSMFKDKGDLASEIWRNIERYFGAETRESNALVQLSCSRPHRVSDHQSVIAASLRSVMNNLRIAKATYTLQRVHEEEPVVVSGDEANFFLAHFEADRDDTCDLNVDLETKDGRKLAVAIKLPFSANESKRHEIHGDIAVEATR